MEKVKFDLSSMIRGVEVTNSFPAILPLRVDFNSKNTIGRAIIQHDGSCELQIDDGKYSGSHLMFAPGAQVIEKDGDMILKMKITEVSVVTEQYANKQ